MAKAGPGSRGGNFHYDDKGQAVYGQPKPRRAKRKQFGVWIDKGGGVSHLHEEEYETEAEARTAATKLGGRAGYSRGAQAGTMLKALEDHWVDLPPIGRLLLKLDAGTSDAANWDKKVKAPGSRGGKYYYDKHGLVKYGTPPTDRAQHSWSTPEEFRSVHAAATPEDHRKLAAAATLDKRHHLAAAHEHLARGDADNEKLREHLANSTAEDETRKTTAREKLKEKSHAGQTKSGAQSAQGKSDARKEESAAAVAAQRSGGNPNPNVAKLITDADRAKWARPHTGEELLNDFDAQDALAAPKAAVPDRGEELRALEAKVKQDTADTAQRNEAKDVKARLGFFERAAKKVKGAAEAVTSKWHPHKKMSPYLNSLTKVHDEKGKYGMSYREAAEITQGFSNPDKMPGYAYGLPAWLCARGSKMNKHWGTVCSYCYALKGRYLGASVRAAALRRYQSINDPKWVQAMATMLDFHAKPHGQYVAEANFRWHDSGDIQNAEHFDKMMQVARLTPGIQHWIPTRQNNFVEQWLAKGNTVPDNVVLRLSGHMVNEANKQKDGSYWPMKGAAGKTWPISSVVDVPLEHTEVENGTWTDAEKDAAYHAMMFTTEQEKAAYDAGDKTQGKSTGDQFRDAYFCPAAKQGGNCSNCRACWNKEIPHIVYPLH